MPRPSIRSRNRKRPETTLALAPFAGRYGADTHVLDCCERRNLLSVRGRDADIVVSGIERRQR